MTLRFGPDDKDAFEAARDALLSELGGWLDLPGRERAGVLADVEVFLDWRYHDSSGVLDEFAPGEVSDFLLRWCPQEFKGHPSGANHLCRAVGVYVDFMADAGRLVGGARRAAQLKALAEDLAPTVRAEMGDPADFGASNPLLAGVEFPPGASHEEIQAVLNARMAEINSLPYEERKALTDHLFDADDDSDDGADVEVEPYELPYVYVPPPTAEAEAAAESALLATMEALRDYLGSDGKALTDKGNLKLADGRALVDLLDTGDEMDPQIGDQTFRTGSTAELSRLAVVLDVAKAAGAVRVYKRRLVPVKAWADSSSLARAAALVASIIELGPLEMEFKGRGIWYFDDLHQLLDDGIVHWLAPLLGEPELPFDNIVESGLSAVARQIAPAAPHVDAESWTAITRRCVSRIFEVLELAGAVLWTDREEVSQTCGQSYWTGGSVTLTALGRLVLPNHLDGAGYVLRRADDVADGDGTDLINALLSVDDTQHGAVIAGWQPDRPAFERVQMLTESIAASTSGDGRLMGFVALQMFDIEVVEPLVRQLLDTPAAGHAALWLIAQGCADKETLGGFVDVGVFIDVLAGDAEDPEELCSAFMASPEPLQLLEEMWRHPAPETAVVLDALGRHLPDKALAKAARKAAMRHRSWMANR